MIAVFARPNHPNYNNGEWRYHGYVIALVRCKTHKEVEAVKTKLMMDGLPEAFPGHVDYEQGWYGGRMDIIALLPGNKLLQAKSTYLTPLRPGREKISIGDNRFAGFYEASDLLAKDDSV